ncbi:MAG: branched-chain amino acid ABC transporter permease [Spirochaetes bacterium]|nr:branched-chain amino acid ABC transporter permease [Spirochaetota bacterium]
MLIDTIKKNKAYVILGAAFLLIAVVYPFAIERIVGRIPSRFFIRIGMDILFFAAMGNAWNIIGGYGRQTSWASPVFFGIGAYTAVLFYLGPPGQPGLGISPLLSMWVGVALAVIVAVIIGLPCFRLRGVYFAIATIACTTIFRQLLIFYSSFTGGNLGLPFPHQPVSRPFFLIFTDFLFRPYYFIALAWMIMTTVIVFLIERNRLGYHLRAICDDQEAAESLGIRSWLVKLQAFMLSAAMLSITGTLYVFMLRMADPNIFASHNMAIRIAIVAILGGMGTKFGPLLGALFTIPLLEFSNMHLGRIGHGGAGWVLYGLLIVVVVLFRPNGLISLFAIGKDFFEKKLRMYKERGRLGGV